MRFTFCCLIFGVLSAAAAAHPPHDDHAHPHNRAHPRSDDRSRFITNRDSEVTLDLPAEDDSFFFVIFGDRTGGPAEGVKVLAEAVRETNLLEPDLVMTVGDLVEGYNDRAMWMEQMREYKTIMDGLFCPWFPVAGNHDIYWRPNDSAPAEEHEHDYEMHFGPLWYAFEHKNCWFMVLYSDEANPRTGERNFNKPECQVMSDEQLEWLRSALKQAVGADHVFVFLHHPRWLGGHYGDDWEKVHEALVEAGNVTAVFAGHIHYMRYDGPRDGIEYVTLATVGGVQNGHAPRAGWLQQFHIITVRKEQVAMAAIPVGEVMDVRAITGTVASETAHLANLRPQFEERLTVHPDGASEGTLRAALSNPASRPIEVTLIADSLDSRWRFAPDHRHAVIEPGRSRTFEFQFTRDRAALDDTFRPLMLRTQMDYLAEGARFTLPESSTPVPLRLNLPAPSAPAGESVLVLDGRDDCVRVPSDLIKMPDGPLTLECWLNAEAFGSRTGLATKTENSEYGIFVNRGVPSFSIFLGDSYVEVAPDRAMLQRGVWHHVAGVFDGQETRLYVDGEFVASARRAAQRRSNRLPLYIGADVDGGGNPTSHFRGSIDAVRLSRNARYSGDRFEPQRRLGADDATAFLFNMDGTVADWLYEESGAAAHGELVGDALLRELE